MQECTRIHVQAETFKSMQENTEDSLQCAEIWELAEVILCQGTKLSSCDLPVENRKWVWSLDVCGTNKPHGLHIDYAAVGNVYRKTRY